jgi:hypothetical protein
MDEIHSELVAVGDNIIPGSIQLRVRSLDRKRVLEIILLVACVVSIPGYLVNLYWYRLNTASAPSAPVTDPQFKAAFDAGVALEQGKQYPQAISKFLEAEMYAGKMPSGKYAALETAIEHYRSCNAALGQPDEVHAASKQLSKLYASSQVRLGRYATRQPETADLTRDFHELTTYSTSCNLNEPCGFHIRQALT